MKKYRLLVFLIQNKLCLPCWHLHGYADVVGFVLAIKAGELLPQVCVLCAISVLPLRTSPVFHQEGICD